MQILLFPIELLTAIFVYAIRLEKRKKLSLRIGTSVLILLLFLMCVLTEVDQNWNHFFVETNFMSSIVGCGIFAFIFTVIVWNICRVSIQEAMYCMACGYLTEHIAYCIRLEINHATAGRYVADGSISHIVIHIVVYLICYHVVAKNMIKDKHYATSALQSLELLLVTVILVVVLSVFASEYNFELIHGIYAAFACGAVLYSQVIQQKQLKLQEELNQRQQIWLKYKAQYDMAKDTVDIINLKCHDLKYQIQALRMMNNQKEQENAIDSMEESVEIYDSVFHTGNEYLDTVLTEKSLLCKKNNIVLTCIADGDALKFMDAVDLYTLFGNALDNAMEAVMKLEENKRLINLMIHEKAGLMIAQIENYYQGEIQIKEELPVTTKAQQAYHGFGIKSMIEIVEKYLGIVKIETENQIFVLRITIPVS